MENMNPIQNSEKLFDDKSAAELEISERGIEEYNRVRCRGWLIASAAAVVIAAAAAIFVNTPQSYPYHSYSQNYVPDKSHDFPEFDDPSFGVGMSTDEFNSKYSRKYVLRVTSHEFSVDIPEGCIIRIKNAEHYGSGMAVAEAVVSDGKAAGENVCDLRNLVDPDEYFAGNTNTELVSHNEFYLADGQLMTVDIKCDTPLAADGWTGTMYRKASTESGGDTAFYGIHEKFSGEWTYKEHFALLLDDYNCDKNPDFCVKAGDSDDLGTYYIMKMCSSRGLENAKISTAKNWRSDDFYVYGEFDSSFRPYRIDDNTFFFLTESYGDVYPMVYRAAEGGFSCPSGHFERNGFIFFAGYYDGRLSAGAVKTDGSPSGISCDMHIEYLDGKVWRRLGKTEHISGKTNDFGKFELTEDIALDSGHYRAVFTDDDLFAAAGFTVR